MEVKLFYLWCANEKLGISDHGERYRLALVIICRPRLEARLHFDRSCGNTQQIKDP